MQNKRPCRPRVEELEQRLLCAADAFEIDDTWQQAKAISLASLTTSGDVQTHSIHVKSDVDWIKFNLSSPTNLLLETRATETLNADTVTWLFRLNSSTNQLEQLDYSDDEGNANYSQILRSGAKALAAGTYYVKVGSWNQASTIDSYSLSVTVTPDFGSSAYRSDNWYWNNQRAPKSVDCANTVLGEALGNCTWFAAGRARELGATAAQISAFDQAYASAFDDRARAAGLTVSSTPMVGAIAQWERGHVAVVERLNKDSTGKIVSIVISESSYADTTSPSAGSKAYGDYLYQIETVSAGGWGNFIYFTNATPTAPLAPTNLTAAASSSSQVSLSWQDNSTNEQGFRIYRWNGSSWASLATVLANVRNFTDTNLQASTTYYYQVAAYNNTGETWSANYVTVTTGAASTLPAAPTNVAWRMTSTTSGYLAWSDNSANELGFRMQYWSGSAWVTFDTLGANATSSRTYGLQAGRTYYFRVAAYNNAGETASSYITVRT